jgi:hypothetical protein
MLILLLILVLGSLSADPVNATQLKAGVAKSNITVTGPGHIIHDSLYVKALVLDDGLTRIAIISIDAIAIGGIGSIDNDFINKVRSQIQRDLNIKPANVLINASHLHGAGYTVVSDVDKRTVEAVKRAWKNRTPVTVGAGIGYEDRIMENRRLELKNGKNWTIRHANPNPPDEEVTGIGPVDPEIGVLRLNRVNGKTLAIVYNFACHPYQGVPDKGTTADFPGFASRLIEDNLGNDATAIFLQGCAGDISTVLYKDVNNPRDAEPLGNMLGLSTLQAIRKIQNTESGNLNVIDEIIKLPKRTDIMQDIESLESEQENLLQSLRSTSLNLKTFIPLYIKYKISENFPSDDSHRYLIEKMTGRNDLEVLDIDNRKNMAKYISNIYAMEKLARIQENMYYLKEHNEASDEKEKNTINVEIQALRIGNFVLVTFPAEVSVQVGLNIKKSSPHKFTFVAAYSNGYIHYAPTAEQFKGEAYEDTNSLLAPEWQSLYEKKVLEILKKL